MGPRAIYIDGYNVIRNTPGLADAERASLAAGREALLARLVARYRHTPHRLVVVFDGDGASESSQPTPGYSRGRVVFTRRGETADAVIHRLTEEAVRDGWDVSVVSDDLEVRLGASDQGAATARVSDLQRRMNEAPRHLRKRFMHQQAVKSILAGEDEHSSADRSKGNPRRSPRKKRDHSGWEPPI